MRRLIPLLAASWIGAAPAADRYLLPAKDVDPNALKSDAAVAVTETAEAWRFDPVGPAKPAALLFFPGGGVEPTAYANLVRAVAAQGWAVRLVKLPPKPAAPDQHRRDSIALGKVVMAADPGVTRWVVGGHSMGGAVAARFVHEEPARFRGLVLIATTHPRDFDLSKFPGDVTKMSGTEDGVAKAAQSEANKRLLPAGTTWVAVAGGNHAQFGDYGPQPGDGAATIPRDQQQREAVAAVVAVMTRASPDGPGLTGPSGPGGTRP